MQGKKPVSSLIYFLLIKAIVMKVNIHSVHFNADVKLINYTTKKINKLNKFQDGIISVDIFLKLDNVVHSIKDKEVEIMFGSASPVFCKTLL